MQFIQPGTPGGTPRLTGGPLPTKVQNMQNRQKSCYLIDWLSYSTKIDSLATIKDDLGLNNVDWEPGKPTYPYKSALYYNNVKIHYNSEKGEGIWVEMTGQGCRVYETFGKNDYMGLLSYLTWNKPEEIKINRIDIAFDDHDGLIDMDRLFDDTINREFVSRFDFYVHHGGSEGKSVEHGKKGSNTMIRIYDKAMERKIFDGTHWIRTEVQLRRQNARQFAEYYVRSGGKVNDVFMGVLNNYLRYVIPDENDTNRWRWEMKDYWKRLTDSAASIQLFVNPGVEYNYQRMESYIIQQAGNAIAAMIEINGLINFNEQIKARGTKKNPKYESIVNECKKGIPIKKNTDKNLDYKDYRFIMQEQDEIPGLFMKDLKKSIFEEKAKILAEKPEIDP